VLVAAAAGNSGDDGLWTYGSPASESDSFAVGSTDNTYSLGAALFIDAKIRVRGQTTNVLGEWICGIARCSSGTQDLLHMHANGSQMKCVWQHGP
jgi:hypothetical protein